MKSSNETICLLFFINAGDLGEFPWFVFSSYFFLFVTPKSFPRFIFHLLHVSEDKISLMLLATFLSSHLSSSRLLFGSFALLFVRILHSNPRPHLLHIRPTTHVVRMNHPEKSSKGFSDREDKIKYRRENARDTRHTSGKFLFSCFHSFLKQNIEAGSAEGFKSLENRALENVEIHWRKSDTTSEKIISGMFGEESQEREARNRTSE